MSEVAIELRDVLGRTLPLTGPYVIQEWDGFGPGAVTHITESGVYADGETFLDARREARTLLIALDVVAESRAELWQYRGNLTRMLSGLAEGCHVVVTLPEGTRREILGRYVGQADMGRKTGDGPLRQRVVLSLHCDDPAFTDPQAELWQYSVGAGIGSWGFPLGFPAGFGVSTIDLEETRTYHATLPAYPIITITGPASSLVISNLATGDKLDLAEKSYIIAVGETVTIDTRPGHKTVTSSVSGNILPHLSNDSDLGTFHLAPDPEAPGGNNTIRVQCVDVTSATRVQFMFYNRYDGAYL